MTEDGSRIVPKSDKSNNETEIERITDDLFRSGSIDQRQRLLYRVQVQAAEAQKQAAKAAEDAAHAAQRNAVYMLWSVIAAAISAVISAAGIAFAIFNH
jgi:hypothetical protein